MALRYPKYYSDFRCIADRCTDNCCIGWEIDVDSDTLDKYRNFDGKLKDKIMSAISDDDNPHFILENERCRFLNDKNLCGLLLEIGEENLCEICSEHPRYYEWFDTLTEVGVGLCCEEAARLILTSDFSLVCDKEFEEDTLTTTLFSARDTLFEIINNKRLSPALKAMNILKFAEKLQPLLDVEDIDGIRKLTKTYEADTTLPKSEKIRIKELIAVFEGLEALSESWTKKLTALKNSTEKTCENGLDYDGILSYYVFRYFIKSAADGDVMSKAAIVVSSYIMLNLLEKDAQNLWDRIEACKEFSKETEYSEEALDAMYSLCERFSVSDFIAMLSE